MITAEITAAAVIAVVLACLTTLWLIDRKPAGKHAGPPPGAVPGPDTIPAAFVPCRCCAGLAGDCTCVRDCGHYRCGHRAPLKFESLLADPAEQFDGRREVAARLLASIAEYASAPPATAALPDMMPAPTVLLPGLGAGGTWTPRESDDTVRYLADAGTATDFSYQPGEIARLREASGADSHVRTDASAPGWLGADPSDSHRSPDWREQTAGALAPAVLDAALPLYVGVAGPVADDDHDPECPCQACTDDFPEGCTCATSAPDCPTHGWDDDDDPDDWLYEPEPRLALPAPPACACVLGNDPLTATTTIGACPVHHDGPLGAPDDVTAVADFAADELAAYALEYEHLTGRPAVHDPVWPPWQPWHLLEDDAERMVSAA